VLYIIKLKYQVNNWKLLQFSYLNQKYQILLFLLTPTIGFLTFFLPALELVTSHLCLENSFFGLFTHTPRVLSFVTGNLTELLVLLYLLSQLLLLLLLCLLLPLVVAAPSHHKNVCAIGFLSSFCYCRRWFGLFMFAMLRLSGFCIWNRRAWKRYDLILIWRSDMIWMHNPDKRFRWGKGHFKSPFSLANIRNYILQHEVFTLQVQLLSIVLHSGKHYYYCSILC